MCIREQTLLSNADTLLQQLQQQRDKHEHMLAILVGGPVHKLTGRLDTQHFVSQAVLAGTPSDLLLNRPEIIAAEHQLQAAHADIQAARAAFFPRIALTANVGTASNEFNQLFSSGNGIWSLVPSISVPIFNAGRLRANVDLAQIRQNAAVVNYEKAIQTSFREVADALSDQHWLQQQLRTQQQSLQAASDVQTCAADAWWWQPRSVAEINALLAQLNQGCAVPIVALLPEANSHEAERLQAAGVHIAYNTDEKALLA